MRQAGNITFLLANTGLAAIIIWLARGRLDVAPAIALAAGIVCIEVGLWYLSLRSRDEASQPNRLVSIMERSAHARRFSIRDESTDLLSRWYLERRLGEEAARCKRYGYPMAVIVLKAAVPDLGSMSIDNWQEKSAEAAQRCLSAVRDVDLSALLAPFEFAICLVQCDREGAERALERLEQELGEFNCLAGIAVLPDDDCEPGAMIELARIRSRAALKQAA